MKSLLSVIITIGLFLIFLIAILSSPAHAGGGHGHGDTQNINASFNGNDDQWKYIIGTAIVTCAVLSAINKRWCWEDKKPEPLPDPGPSVKNDKPIGIKLY